jgi:GAF domain-containing protein
LLALAAMPGLAQESPQQLFERAMRERERGELHQAIRSFHAILDEHPGLNRARLELAVAYYQALDHRAALERLADLVVRDVADWCVIDLIDEGDLKRAVVARAEPTLVGTKLGDSPGSGIGAVAQSGRARILPAPGETTNGEPVRFLDGLEARSVISVPLRARKQPLGALTVARTTRGETFDANDLALVEDLAVRIGLALDRGRLYRLVEERADAARVLEQGCEQAARAVVVLDP